MSSDELMRVMAHQAVRDELARVTAERDALRGERDRLQRACDKGLPREVIACPSCGMCHVEGPRHDDPTVDGRTRPHHTHRCYGCDKVWESGQWTFGVAPGSENEVVKRLRAEGRAGGLQEALDACRSVMGRMRDLADDGGGPVACAEAFGWVGDDDDGEADAHVANEEECEMMATGACLCSEAVAKLLAERGGA